MKVCGCTAPWCHARVLWVSYQQRYQRTWLCLANWVFVCVFFPFRLHSRTTWTSSWELFWFINACAFVSRYFKGTVLISQNAFWLASERDWNRNLEWKILFLEVLIWTETKIWNERFCFWMHQSHYIQFRKWVWLVEINSCHGLLCGMFCWAVQADIACWENWTHFLTPVWCQWCIFKQSP